MPEKTLRDEILESFYLAITSPSIRSLILSNAVSVTALVHDCYRHMYYRVKFPVELYNPTSAMRMWIGRKLHETQLLEDSMMEFEIEWNGIYTISDTKDTIEVKSHELVTLVDENDEKVTLPIYIAATRNVGYKKLIYNDVVYDKWIIRRVRPGLLGHVDEYSPKHKIILEKKTTRKSLRKPYEHHKRQVYYYAVMLTSLGYEVDKGAIIYIDVNDARANVFDFEIPDLWEISQEMLVKFETIRKALEKNVLPPRYLTTWEEDSPRLVCEYCDYFSICMSENVVSGAVEAVRKYVEDEVE